MRVAPIVPILLVLTMPIRLHAQSRTEGPVGRDTPGAADAVIRPPVVEETFLELDDGTIVRYAVAIPHDASDAPGSGAEVSERLRPLVLALHPGGRSPSYGRWFMESTVEPALRDWGAIVVAPDVPDRNWTTELSERALLAVMARVMGAHAIDRGRILVTGFSMGGRGSWHMAVRHPELFTGAIVMAGAPGDAALGDLAPVPLYLIHSPDDEVVPFEPVRETYEALVARGRDVVLATLPGVSHYTMGAYVPAFERAARWMATRWGG